MWIGQLPVAMLPGRNCVMISGRNAWSIGRSKELAHDGPGLPAMQVPIDFISSIDSILFGVSASCTTMQHR